MTKKIIPKEKIDEIIADIQSGEKEMVDSEATSTGLSELPFSLAGRATRAVVTVSGQTLGAETVNSKNIVDVTGLVFDIAGGVFRAYQGTQLAIDIGMDSVTKIECVISRGVYFFIIN